nr:hypothetical protein CFP56_75015 [Quercus suber]
MVVKKYISFRSTQTLQGFKEYMNLILDDVEEVNIKRRGGKSKINLTFLNLNPFPISPPPLIYLCAIDY